MLFRGIPGYFVEPDGQLSCLDCSLDFILENQYHPTEHTTDMVTVSPHKAFTKVRCWASSKGLEDMWVPDLGEES